MGFSAKRRKKVFNYKLSIALQNKSPDWTMPQLDKLLTNLKNNLSRDHQGYINKIFKPAAIGKDLKLSLLIMFNKIKQSQLLPFFMLQSNITTIPKYGKTGKLYSKCQRGIFRISILRGILMRLIYNQHYETIDKNIFESNIGGRKGRSCRNHIFVINCIKHDMLSSRNLKLRHHHLLTGELP